MLNGVAFAAATWGALCSVAYLGFYGRWLWKALGSVLS